jgi:hypothetical protein
MSQSLTPVFLHTLELMLEQIRLPSILSTTINLDFLATEYADWISHTTQGMPTSKLGLLCTPAFQSVAGGGLGDSFVKNFRLLLWTTSLLYIAMNGEVDPQDAPAHEAALRNLKKLINACGKRVVLHLDVLCHPGAINNMPVSLQKQLFLVIIGLCLSATYMVKASQRFLIYLHLELKKMQSIPIK